MYQDKQRPILL